MILFLLRIVIYTFWLIIFLTAGSFLRLVFSRGKQEQEKIDTKKLRKGDVILTGTNRNLSSWHIKMSNILTNGIKSKFWTHVALYIEDGKLIEACPEGIVYNTIESYTGEGALSRVYRNKYIQDDEKTLDALVNFCERTKEDDYSYGWVGLLFYTLASCLPISMNFIFNNDFVDRLCNLDKAYFCSELVADAYKEAGYRISPHDSWRIKPSDFMKNPFFEEVVSVIEENETAETAP